MSPDHANNGHDYTNFLSSLPMKPGFLTELNALLGPAIEAGRAGTMRAYMREQFEFLGIPTPARRAAAKPLLKNLKTDAPESLFNIANALWDLPEREYQYIALDLLAMHYRSLNRSHIPSLLRLAQIKSWWDTVDGLAGIVGEVLNGDHSHMDAALNHDNMWIRRIAILHQLGWRANTDSQRLFNYALAVAHEKEFFIQKAVGWALRDYARHNPEAVRKFIAENKTVLSRLSVREASKHLL